MRITNLKDVGTDYAYQWPVGIETFEHYIDYEAPDTGRGKPHTIRIGFCKNRPTYGTNRIRIVVWIDGYPYAEFLGADDFEKSGEVLSVVKVGSKDCSYIDDVIPERYVPFRVVGLKTRVSGKGTRNAWAIVANVTDHKTMVALAGLRRLEKDMPAAPSTP